jgi:hypothetical protein
MSSALLIYWFLDVTGKVRVQWWNDFSDKTPRVVAIQANIHYIFKWRMKYIPEYHLKFLQRIYRMHYVVRCWSAMQVTDQVGSVLNSTAEKTQLIANTDSQVDMRYRMQPLPDEIR